MKTLDLNYNALTAISTKVFALRNKLAQVNSVQLHLPFQFGASQVKPIKTYLIGLLNEGLKQNLLGAEIDMEFLVLSVRTYGKALLHLTVGKHPTDQLSN